VNTPPPHGQHLAVGINLNNREPLLVPSYDLGALLDLAVLVEESGFDSVFVGDSLFSKPRFEALTLLGALTQRTTRVRLGTSALVASLRDPLYLAVQWATLDHLSGGRMILGAAAGNAEPRVRQEFDSIGVEFGDRMSRLEECLHVVRRLLAEGAVTFDGTHFRYDDVSLYSGTEIKPLTALQPRPPIWVVSNPNIMSPAHRHQVERACRRILEYGDGWLTCCRAAHPDELEQQSAVLSQTAAELGVDLGTFEIAYQVTMTLGDSREDAESLQRSYISAYYPELVNHVGLAEWGPVGTPEDILAWLRRFADVGVTHFVCRFGAVDQFGQVRQFAEAVLPDVRRIPGVVRSNVERPSGTV
jgi:alkanesulfonate monooxygenase SsuD/methylene tetrahydromethanopterin reductase-like flavin-dependent oxidoreductase (luciferase family)